MNRLDCNRGTHSNHTPLKILQDMAADKIAAMPAQELLDTLKVAPTPPPAETDDAKARRPKTRGRAARVAASQMARLELMIAATGGSQIQASADNGQIEKPHPLRGSQDLKEEMAN